MSEARIIRDYIDEWKTYIHALNSQRMRPTPSLTDRQPIDPEELDELKLIIDYERQLTANRR